VTHDDVAYICGSPPVSLLSSSPPHAISSSGRLQPHRFLHEAACREAREVANGANATSSFFSDGPRHSWEVDTVASVRATGEHREASRSGFRWGSRHWATPRRPRH
jgi:hypothetical protein